MFDSTYLRRAQWTCPHCARRAPADIVIDGFLLGAGGARARAATGSPDVSRVEVTPDGRWRPLAGDDGGPPGATARAVGGDGGDERRGPRPGRLSATCPRNSERRNPAAAAGAFSGVEPKRSAVAEGATLESDGGRRTRRKRCGAPSRRRGGSTTAATAGGDRDF